jgi:hypothetical protein
LFGYRLNSRDHLRERVKTTRLAGTLLHLSHLSPQLTAEIPEADTQIGSKHSQRASKQVGRHSQDHGAKLAVNVQTYTYQQSDLDQGEFPVSI